MTVTQPYFALSAHVDAPVHTVFEYCRDPRKLHDGDPIEVVDADVTDAGPGTTAQLRYPAPFPLDEDVAFTFTEEVPDERIVFEAVPTLWMRGHHRPHHGFPPDTFIWTFEPEDGGTRLGVEVRVPDVTLSYRLGRKSMIARVQARLDRVVDHIEHPAAA
ncbi:SRPBCC family protein [Demequina sp. SYSU T00192]|uniref:SRPBCC family protein n=1 Tax=Demequina litoralis TaxID=3051660 RepID=A0ABT8G5F1_9MICO|nr:SRPBCC family protein [Demequina sp. SYSU T00192]MDN4474366.1 SRPBCC family protein [Demequina sp. SYSU T00192]